MKKILILTVISCTILFSQCKNEDMKNAVKIVFLHHSTGSVIWRGNPSKILYKLNKKGDVTKWINQYNKTSKTNYQITETAFPKRAPYGWKNYPYDYYNIWVQHAGEKAYKEEPTLEILTKKYDVIILKHCFPVGKILPDSTISPTAGSNIKTLANFKLQYEALKQKFHQFPNHKFIVWTPAALTEKGTTEEMALRAQIFYNWVVNDWDEKGDNIYLWDFYQLETEGSLYLKAKNAVGPKNSHPNSHFAGKVAPLFAQRIVNVIEGKGDTTSLTGQ